jgi:hypothetical protein
MPTLPKSNVSRSDEATAQASGTRLICAIAPVPLNADGKPRQFSSPSAVNDQHGYSEGLEYVALHSALARLPVLFCGIPIVTPGVIGQVDTSGNTGTSAVSVTAGSDGVLHEHGGKVIVATGGTIGTDQIVLKVSCDDGRSYKRARVGTASSYVVPYVGAELGFGAGTLVAGDVIATWQGSGPRGDAAGWALARTELAKKQIQFRTALVVGDLQDSTEATSVLNQAILYETLNERYTLWRASVYDRIPLAVMSGPTVRMTGSPSLTFAEVGGTGDTITRSTGSWITDGFKVGGFATFDGTVGNDITARIAALSATVMTLDADDLIAEVAPTATVVGYDGLNFANTGETITRSNGSWIADGFRVGRSATIVGTAGATNDGTFVIAAVTDLVLTLAASGVTANERASFEDVTITVGQTAADWMSEIDTEFAGVNGEQIALSAGRGRYQSPFTGWYYRFPSGFAASLREYQHDLHVAPWRKSDKETGFDINDADGNLYEWDDFEGGEAGVAARFTCFRTYPNDAGAYIALSLTRGDEDSLLVQTHNTAVALLAQQIANKAVGDAAIGTSIQLNADGTATTDALALIKGKVDDALDLGLMQDALGEGPRASFARFYPHTDTIFNVPEPTLLYDIELGLNGTIHSVTGKVRIKSGG